MYPNSYRQPQSAPVPPRPIARPDLTVRSPQAPVRVMRRTVAVQPAPIERAPDPAPRVQRPVAKPVTPPAAPMQQKPVAVVPNPIPHEPAPRVEPAVEVPPAPTPAPIQPSVFELNLDNVPAAPNKRSKYLVKPRRLSQIVVSVMAISLFAVGGYISLGAVKANQEVSKTVKQLSSSSGAAAAGAPETKKPSTYDISSYKVAPDMPRVLRIPSLKTEARVLALGLDKKGAVAAPSNVHDAAWYNQSDKPGQPGAAFINGHVSSWTTDGVFYSLRKATPGMLIEIERGDGSVLQYKVVKSEVYPAESVDMKAALNPVTLDKEGLNLMTCTGKVKPGTNEFDSRLLVRAERVN